MTRTSFDIAVIGAGPAGSTAALQAARLGRSVVLFDRNERVGTPVRCGEGIGLKSFVSHAGNHPEWTLHRIRTSVMVSPSGIRVTIGNIDESYLLDREKMDADLAAEAAKTGATLLLRTPVTEVRRDPDGRYACITPAQKFSASCLIIADGVESRIARFLGWNTALSPADVETCAFCRVTSPLIDQDACVFHTGTTVAPGGYAWIFPRGKSEANVGLGIIGTRSSSGLARDRLMEFLDRELPGAHATGLHCGGVPVARYTRPLVRDGAMLVGDAARQVNCISGAGIHYSLFAGKLAGTMAAEAVSTSGAVDYAKLRRYETGWRKTYGKQQERSFALKEFVEKTDDAFLDRIASSLAKEPPEKMNYLRVFTRTFAKRPLLLLKAMRLFG
ncbi:MAG: NAD(P)/FAD-dependent oxidoreductase [Chitinispirillaceae bacterium]|nr:NAD(P)/FAD-dependent oxidoreductase [Chitinispirillaceae bacterium]